MFKANVFLPILAGSTLMLASIACFPTASTRIGSAVGSHTELPAPTSQPAVVAISNPTIESNPAAVVSITEETLFNEIYTRTAPSVVRIDVFTQTGGGEGSGFILDTEGHIVTNAHVVNSAEQIRVSFFDGFSTPAKVIGVDGDSDLAVIKVDVDASLLRPIALGDSDIVQVGQRAIALGSPFGQSWTLTTGIVSAVGRSIQGFQSQYTIPEAIQTDAAINPGNSGGPLMNADGEVIGVNAQIISESGSNSGIGFAIPVNIVKRIVPELIQNGKFEYAYLGIQGGGVTAEFLQANDLPTNVRGVVVATTTPGGPAEQAGVKAATGERNVNGIPVAIGADVITAINGQSVQEMGDLIAYFVKQTRPGDSVTLTVLRDGQSMEISVTLGKRPNS